MYTLFKKGFAHKSELGALAFTTRDVVWLFQKHLKGTHRSLSLPFLLVTRDMRTETRKGWRFYVLAPPRPCMYKAKTLLLTRSYLKG